MYAVIDKGNVIGMCETPRYIRVKHGIYVDTKKEKAEGVAIGGKAYLFKDGVLLSEVDGWEIVFSGNVKLSEVNEGLQDTQDALCETTTDLDQRIADIEDALCELTE